MADPELPYAQVVHRVLGVGADTDADADLHPDLSVLEGLKVTFTPQPSVIKWLGAGGPVTHPNKVVTGIYDSQGYLRLTQDSTQEGVWLLASSHEDMVPSGWTYTAKWSLNAIPAVTFAAPPGAVIDLTTVIPVPANPGSQLTDWLATVEAAQAAQAAAEAAASEAGLARDGAVLAASGVGSGVARLIARARAGEDLTITCLGDSILEGQTVTNPATDGAMVLLAADLSARFGVTITQTNQAKSGYTALRAHVSGNVSAAIAENADLYIVSAFDKNDLGADIGGVYAPGYASDASNAAVERIIRAIRANVPKADIIVMSTNPYMPGSSSNAYQAAKDAASRQIAATYGCEWVDCYEAFTALGDWSALMADTTHPNTAGHRLIADTLLAHIPDRELPVGAFPGIPADGGIHHPEQVNMTLGEFGFLISAAPGAAPNGLAYTTGGTGWSEEVTATVGDYVEVAHDYCSELSVQVSTLAADGAVVDVAIDGVTVGTSIALADQGKQGAYWITPAYGLTPGSHTLRLTLVSGTLRTYTVAALAAQASTFAPAVARRALSTSSVMAMDTTGAYITPVKNAMVRLPDGWASAIMEVHGRFTVRVTGAITERRYLEIKLSTPSGAVDQGLKTFQAATEEQRDSITLEASETITADSWVTVEARLLSTVKTLCQITAFNVWAILHRIA